MLSLEGSGGGNEFHLYNFYLKGRGRVEGVAVEGCVNLPSGSGRIGAMVAGASSARAAGYRAGTGCETVYGRFYLSGFLFLRFGRLGA